MFSLKNTSLVNAQFQADGSNNNANNDNANFIPQHFSEQSLKKAFTEPTQNEIVTVIR